MFFFGSDIIMHYRWENREVNEKNDNEEKNWENLELNEIFIDPKVGIFQPHSLNSFLIFVETDNLVADEYRTVLQ